MAYNLVILIGNLVEDPVLKTTANGVFTSKFRIAVNRQDGKTADFINIRTWRKEAEFVCKNYSKGKPIRIEGELHVDIYKDKNGATRYETEVLAKDVGFAG